LFSGFSRRGVRPWLGWNNASVITVVSTVVITPGPGGADNWLAIQEGTVVNFRPNCTSVEATQWGLDTCGDGRACQILLATS